MDASRVDLLNEAARFAEISFAQPHGLTHDTARHNSVTAQPGETVGVCQLPQAFRFALGRLIANATDHSFEQKPGLRLAETWHSEFSVLLLDVFMFYL